MTYKVELETRAKREFRDLTRQVCESVVDVIDDLQANPRPPGAKKLVGENGYRVRSGDYRILYTVDDSSHTVRIYRIGHRRNVYRRL
ncbi:MAG: Plasmid stabilization system protein [Acidobacteria bacterium]|nr:Plasmid stabilization system protein [Acidobacteriota bacterium]